MRKLKTGVLLALFTGALSGTAQAATVTYTTSGSFAGPGAGACPAIIDGADPASCVFQTDGDTAFALDFEGTGFTVLTPGTADVAIFDLFIDSLPPGSTTTVLPGTTFSLTIDQTVPGAANGAFSSTLTGTVGEATGNLILSFDSPTTIVLAGVRYDLVLTDADGDSVMDDLVLDTAFLVNNPTIPGVAESQTELKANITFVPEPASMSLLGIAVFGLGALRRKVAA